MITAHLKMARLFAEGAGELHVQFELASGSLTALVGPSGSGKTTLLRLLSGLETPILGRIQVDDTIWLDRQQNVNLRPQQRSVGYIFQNAALFPNLTVWENILFVTPKGETGRADELISATGLGPFVHKKPTALSGGQQQRVAPAVIAGRTLCRPGRRGRPPVTRSPAGVASGLENNDAARQSSSGRCAGVSRSGYSPFSGPDRN
ncbi:ATP-binding cassette domain-containing protein [Spirosoma lituiforme]